MVKLGFARPAIVVAVLSAMTFSSDARAQDARVTFLHVNDIYVMEGKDGSGLAPLLTLMERERRRARGQTLRRRSSHRAEILRFVPSLSARHKTPSCRYS